MFIDYMPSPEGFESVGVFRTFAVFTDAHSMSMVQFWYPLTDVYCIVSSVEFGDELPISVMRIRAIRHKSFKLKITKLLKSQNVQTPAPFYFTPRLFKPCIRNNPCKTSNTA
jgi:hypothetical protein